MAILDFNPLFIDQVYAQLVQAISLGDLKPGQRVRQSVLADMLGVSRQPISHALQVLKHQGLVRDAGRQGVEVAPIEPDYILHLYVVRNSLERAATELAAARVADGRAAADDLAALQQALDKGCRASDDGAPLALLVSADAEFHHAVYRLSGNPVIEQMMTGQWPHLMRSMLHVLDDPGVPQRAWEEHTVIATHIRAGKLREAGDTAEQHVRRAGADLHQRLAKRLRALDTGT